MTVIDDKNCTFDLTEQNRLLSIVEFNHQFGVINERNFQILINQIKAILESKYQLNAEEVEQIIALTQITIKNDFFGLETDFNTICYVILGHDLENIKLGRFNEFNWLYKAILKYIE